jgi:23S rRNA pseudouridine1911/1915/1917 synthase
MRLDIHLQDRYPEYSRATLQNQIKAGKVTVNGTAQLKSGFAVKPNDEVNLNLDFDTSPLDVHLDIPVLYEDADCVVINKPTGILTHSKGVFNPEASVATWLSQRDGFTFEDESDNPRAGIVHRLDRATSGVMIMAKHEVALKYLQRQFHDRKAKKVYVARIEGALEPPQAIIDLPIERNPKAPQRFRVGHNGKPAKTEYETKQLIGGDSIVTMKPYTGRTHQLRVHMVYMKHPIVGDTFYEGRKADRLYLHANELEITIPSSDRKTFIAPVPEVFFEPQQ